ncbi:hypothetical protein [Pleurocapsa sp. CCALA 161]|uniref:hypothetical protein n=1 Tax=Pleurocapsa sp. CCALA 161 TaxID=2107688 RepID=UPI001304DF04|nr:hypothetical protein [Pleurocapsa sp. CCALA 161]
MQLNRICLKKVRIQEFGVNLMAIAGKQDNQSTSNTSGLDLDNYLTSVLNQTITINI